VRSHCPFGITSRCEWTFQEGTMAAKKKAVKKVAKKKTAKKKK
jgi:hypothetical protein